MPNENCLEGISCPKCGFEDGFNIRGESIFHVRDDGTAEFGDVDWDQDSLIVCRNCGHRGTVKEFSLKEDFKKIANKFVGDIADFQKEIACHSRNEEWDSLQTALDLFEEEIKKVREHLPRTRALPKEE